MLNIPDAKPIETLRTDRGEFADGRLYLLEGRTGLFRKVCRERLPTVPNVAMSDGALWSFVAAVEIHAILVEAGFDIRRVDAAE